MNRAVERVGYFPGVIGQITTLHAVYYKKYWGLDHSFEAQVAREVADFISNFDERKDGLWNAVPENQWVGCIAIAGDRDQVEDARLRWYIVDPQWQGQGIGRMLIEKAIDFSKRAGYKRVYLWTFEGLHQAQFIYETNGFKLAEVRDVPQWGGIIREQRYELRLRN